MESDEQFQALAISNSWSNLTKQNLIETLSSYDITTLLRWRNELFEDAKYNESFPPDRALKKRRGGNQLSHKLSEDCYMLYSFVQGSVTVSEISELFSSGLAKPQLFTPQGTPVNASQSRTPSINTLGTPCSGRKLPSTPQAQENRVTPPSANIVDALASIQAQLHANREDTDILKKELYELKDTSAQPPKCGGQEAQPSFIDVAQNLGSAIENIQNILQRRTNKITSLEKQITSVLSENKSLQNKIADQSKAMQSLHKKLITYEGEISALKSARNSDISNMRELAEGTTRKLKEVKMSVKNLEADMRDVKCQVGNIREPELNECNALKNEQKRLKDCIFNMSDDICRIDKLVTCVKDGCNQMNKDVAREINKLKKGLHSDTRKPVTMETADSECQTSKSLTISVDTSSFNREVVYHTGSVEASPSVSEQNIETQRGIKTSENKKGTLNGHRNEEYYIGGITNKNVDSNVIRSFLEKKNINVRFVKVMPSNKSQSLCAKIAIREGHGYDLCKPKFFPDKTGTLYCRRWYNYNE